MAPGILSLFITAIGVQFFLSGLAAVTTIFDSAALTSQFNGYCNLYITLWSAR